MALLPLYASQSYTPGSAMTIAAISELIGNLFSGVGGMYEAKKQRQMEEDWRQKQYDLKKQAMDEAAARELRKLGIEEAEHKALYGPAPETAVREMQGVDVGPPEWMQPGGEMPSLYFLKHMSDIEAGRRQARESEATIANIMQNIAESKYRMSDEYYRREAALRTPRGGAGEEDYLDLGRFINVLGDLPEKFDRAMMTLNPDDPESVAALETIVDQMTMLAPHPEAIRVLDSQLSGATTREEAAQIYSEFQRMPAIDRGDEMVAYKLYQFAMKTKPAMATEEVIGEAPESPYETGTRFGRALRAPKLPDYSGVRFGGDIIDFLKGLGAGF